MRLRHFPRQEPPPVTEPRVPDVAKRRHLGRAEARADREKQEDLFRSVDVFSEGVE